jgi:pimeloyl-ACP methyl ester carboxylesterase
MTSLDATGIALHRAGTGAPLVLLHCLGVDHRFWNFAFPLESRFTLLRYDLPGHGATRVPERPYSIQDLAEQLAALLHANRSRRASIAGISLGGLVAQSFAASHSERVDSTRSYNARQVQRICPSSDLTLRAIPLWRHMKAEGRRTATNRHARRRWRRSRRVGGGSMPSPKILS